MNDPERMGAAPIGRLLFSFSLPAIFGTMVTSLYVVIDRAFVSKVVGPEAISGVGMTMPISLMLMAFGMLIAIGATARVSILLGQRKPEEASKVLGNAFTLAMLLSVLISGILLLFLDGILRAFGASDAALPYARQFIGIILLGSPFQFIAYGLNGIVGAMGNPRRAMVANIINAGLNVVLLILFIQVLGWGVRGSALATLISQAVASVFVLAYLFGRKAPIRLRAAAMRLDRETVLSILTIGVSPFLMQFAGSVVNVFLNRQLLTWGGEFAVGAAGIIVGVMMLFLMPVIGLTQGAQPIVGFNFGARSYERVKRTLALTIGVATIWVVAVWGLVQLFPTFFVSIFTADPGLTKLAAEGIRLYIAAWPVDGFVIVTASFFLAIGSSSTSMLLNMLRQVILMLPLVFILPRFLGLPGVWLAMPAADMVSAGIAALLLTATLGRLGTASKTQPAPEHLVECEELALAEGACYEGMHA